MPRLSSFRLDSCVTYTSVGHVDSRSNSLVEALIIFANRQATLDLDHEKEQDRSDEAEQSNQKHNRRRCPKLLPRRVDAVEENRESRQKKRHCTQ